MTILVEHLTVARVFVLVFVARLAWSLAGVAVQLIDYLWDRYVMRSSL
jgi:hypothetical protein